MQNNDVDGIDSAPISGLPPVFKVNLRTHPSGRTERDIPAPFASEAIVQGCAGSRCIKASTLPTSGSRALANQPVCLSGNREM